VIVIVLMHNSSRWHLGVDIVALRKECVSAIGYELGELLGDEVAGVGRKLHAHVLLVRLPAPERATMGACRERPILVFYQ